jgi:hypothetical protein
MRVNHIQISATIIIVHGGHILFQGGVTITISGDKFSQNFISSIRAGSFIIRGIAVISIAMFRDMRDVLFIIIDAHGTEGLIEIRVLAQRVVIVINIRSFSFVFNLRHVDASNIVIVINVDNIDNLFLAIDELTVIRESEGVGDVFLVNRAFGKVLADALGQVGVIVNEKRLFRTEVMEVEEAASFVVYGVNRVVLGVRRQGFLCDHM